MPDRLQQGIYFRTGERPPPCYRLLLVNAESGAGGARVHEALAATMRMLHQLSDGYVRELVGQGERDAAKTREQFHGLSALIGYGRRLFDDDVHEPPLTGRPRPEFLVYLRGDEVSPAVPWAGGRADENRGEADVAVQLIGSSEAAVNRAAVEIWKLIADERLPIEVVATFSGFQRGDGRGWLEFHDGVSNIESSQRLAALEAGSDPPWMAGGTYMAFFRFSVDLTAWRLLTRSQQELVVGRDKLTGAPLIATARDESGTAIPIAARPRSDDATDAERADFDDPPQATDPLIEASHLHRANQNRASPFASAGHRMFRQGYDFLEDIGPHAPVLGLNFVSFQRDLSVLQHVLHLPGWLGDVNFGGPTNPRPGEPPAPRLVELQAGGFYAVPTVPFPGASLFEGS